MLVDRATAGPDVTPAFYYPAGVKLPGSTFNGLETAPRLLRVQQCIDAVGRQQLVEDGQKSLKHKEYLGQCSNIAPQRFHLGLQVSKWTTDQLGGWKYIPSTTKDIEVSGATVGCFNQPTNEKVDVVSRFGCRGHRNPGEAEEGRDLKCC